MLYVKLINPMFHRVLIIPIERMRKPFMLLVICAKTCSTRARIRDLPRLLLI